MDEIKKLMEVVDKNSMRVHDIDRQIKQAENMAKTHKHWERENYYDLGAPGYSVMVSKPVATAVEGLVMEGLKMEKSLREKELDTSLQELKDYLNG